MVRKKVVPARIEHKKEDTRNKTVKVSIKAPIKDSHYVVWGFQVHQDKKLAYLIEV